MKADDFKILIVDDESGMREFLAGFCDVNGYKAVLASNGEEALELIGHSEVCDLVIVDFLMPGMHGVEFIRRARKQRPGLPIIAMSAWDDVEDSFIGAGANLFLRKPFDPYFLEKAIEVIARVDSSNQPNERIARLMEMRMPLAVPDS